jgi:hypothetical protein
MNRYILTTYNITDTIIVNGYYTFNDIQMQYVDDWFNDFTESYYIDDSITITPTNFTISEIEYDINCENFINKYGNPCNILEHIDDLSDVFDNTYERIRTLSVDTEDSDLYTGTEDVSRLINAHLSGNHEEIQSLLTEKEFDEDDDIVKKIIKNIKN